MSFKACWLVVTCSKFLWYDAQKANCISFNIKKSYVIFHLIFLLQQLGLLQEGQRVEDQFDFERLFKNIWADHADVISTQYSGTGALKTDFTRTGKRTKSGLVRDGVNSLVRYYKNNFADGFRQVIEL